LCRREKDPDSFNLNCDWSQPQKKKKKKKQRKRKKSPQAQEEKSTVDAWVKKPANGGKKGFKTYGKGSKAYRDEPRLWNQGKKLPKRTTEDHRQVSQSCVESLAKFKGRTCEKRGKKEKKAALNRGRTEQQSRFNRQSIVFEGEKCKW